MMTTDQAPQAPPQTVEKALETEARAYGLLLLSETTIKTEIEALTLAMEQTPEGQKVTEARRSLTDVRDNLSFADGALREKLLEIFEETKDKSPYPGLGIRVSTKIRVEYDHAKAEEWARANAPILLTLDTRAFEEMAQASPGKIPAEIVQVVEEHKAGATISKPKLLKAVEAQMVQMGAEAQEYRDRVKTEGEEGVPF